MSLQCCRCAILIGAGVLAGCTSSKSTMLTRDNLNSEWVEHKVSGVPITLQVPTHLKLYVYDIHLLKTVSVGGVEDVEFMEQPRMRDFASELLTTEKIVMVDFKRPAAGAFNLNVKFKGQYLDQYQQDITEETIARVGEFFQRLAAAGFQFAPTGIDAGATSTIRQKVAEVKSVAAVGIFELDAPDFELQVKEFLNTHLNCGAGCDVSPVGLPKTPKMSRNALGSTPVHVVRLTGVGKSRR